MSGGHNLPDYCPKCQDERERTAGQRLRAASGSAFVRQCDICGKCTAIDLDPTPKRWREMCLYGQTIRTVTKDEAMELWKTAGRCKCTPNDRVERP